MRRRWTISVEPRRSDSVHLTKTALEVAFVDGGTPSRKLTAGIVLAGLLEQHRLTPMASRGHAIGDDCCRTDKMYGNQSNY